MRNHIWILCFMIAALLGALYGGSLSLVHEGHCAEQARKQAGRYAFHVRGQHNTIYLLDTATGEVREICGRNRINRCGGWGE